MDLWCCGCLVSVFCLKEPHWNNYISEKVRIQLGFEIVCQKGVFPCYHSGYQTPVRSLSVKLWPTLNCIKSFTLYDHTKGENVLELHQLVFDFKLCEPLQYALFFYFLQPRAQQGPHLWLQLLGNLVIQTINNNLY